MRATNAAVVIAILALCGGCQSTSGPVTEVPMPSAAEAAYHLGPGDKIRVLTFGEAALTGEFTLNELGRVSLPLIGNVQGGGLTVQDFTQEVTAKLAAGFLKNPRVSVEVLNYRPFYILGEVIKPGEYPFISGLTVINAVATAGGFSYRANIHRVFVRGQRESREHPVPVTGTTLVHPGDTLRIPERLF